MSWNHRVIRHLVNGEYWYAIHETFYGTPFKTAFTDSPTPVAGDAIEDLRWTLDHMLKCLDQPVIDAKTKEEIP